jgi:hypothetical protein
MEEEKRENKNEKSLWLEMNWYTIPYSSYYFLSFWMKESIIAIVSKRIDIGDLTSWKV